MFYAAEAMLLTKEKKFKKHSAVIASFSAEFIKTGLLPVEMSKHLRKGYEYRMQGDYGPVPVESKAAEAILKSAGEFVETIEAHLKKEGFFTSDEKTT